MEANGSPVRARAGPDRGGTWAGRVGSAAVAPFLLAVLLLLFTFFTTPAVAREVRLPLTVEPPLLQALIERQIFTQAGRRAVLWGEPGGCSFFYLEDPKVDGEVGRLRVIAHGNARLGTGIGSQCLSPIAWSGFIELFEKPRLDGWQVRFDVVDSNLYDEEHEKTLLVGELWDRIKASVQPRFAAVVVDLGAPFRQLREFLPFVLTAGPSDEIRAALDSMRPVSVRALPKGIVVEAAVDLPEAAPAPTPVAAEPPLTEAEIEAFTKRINEWDAFVTFVIKALGAKTLSPSAHEALLETLLDARYELIAALAAPSRGPDPVRALFLQSWERLRPVADDISRQMPEAEAAGVLSFVAAGDALRALDQMGPTVGVEISADGLRRMARMIEPATTEDPLRYGTELDPSLRHLLGFGAPITEETPAPALSPSSRWWNPWRWLGDGSAHAAVDHSRDWKGWVAEKASDLDAYLKRVGSVLDKAAQKMIARDKPSSADAKLFRKLVPATAWQESCWRQFHVEKGSVTYLRSSRSSVGLLQVNERVWRGFYDETKLRWDIAYNADAGSEVLLRYLGMVDDAKPKDASPPKGAEKAKAAYAAYNGGPSQLRRYLDPKRGGKALDRVIQLFGAKFEATGDDTAARVASCLRGDAA